MSKYEIPIAVIGPEPLSSCTIEQLAEGLSYLAAHSSVLKDPEVTAKAKPIAQEIWNELQTRNPYEPMLNRVIAHFDHIWEARVREELVD